MQVGEGVSVDLANSWGNDGKCVFCGKSHENKKEDKIKPTGWKRQQISSVGDHFVGDKLALYPEGSAPPNTFYRSEGHHCVAFSSFMRDAKNENRDYFAPVNHYLKEKEYEPNNLNNRIDLPARKEKDDTSPEAQFKEYEKAWQAANKGNGKPMQLHIGGHKSDLMQASDVLIQDLYNLLGKPKLCENPDQDDWKTKLLNEMKEKEDEAFKATAMVEPPFVCHPSPLQKAEQYVKTKHNVNQIIYPIF